MDSSYPIIQYVVQNFHQPNHRHLLLLKILLRHGIFTNTTQHHLKAMSISYAIYFQGQYNQSLFKEFNISA